MLEKNGLSGRARALLTSLSLAVVVIVILLLTWHFTPTGDSAGCTSPAPTATVTVVELGLDGLSAYDLWIAEGNTGTKQDFLDALVGVPGPSGYSGSNGISGADGKPGRSGAQGEVGETGKPGASAYQLWLDAGNSGTAEEFLNSLMAEDGVDGVAGLNGLSAYELWLSIGNQGEVSDFIASLKGASGTDGLNGADGLSAYEIWVANGNEGKTEADFLASLKGNPGTCTVVGDGLPYNASFFDTTTQNNSAKPNLMRFNTTDPWSAGIYVNSANKSRIVFEHPGVYNIQFSSQFTKTDSGTDFIDIWLRKNGSDVPMTNTELRSWGNDDRQVASWNFFVQVENAGDYFELAWQSDDTNISMLSTPSNGKPGIPSVILTVTQVN